MSVVDTLPCLFFPVGKGIHPCLVFGGARFGHPADPVDLLAHHASGLLHFHFLVVHQLGLLLQIVAVVSLELHQLALIQLHDFIADVFQEISIVAYQQQCYSRSAEVPLQPFNHINVQVVGRLVKDQKIRLLQEHTCQCKAFLLTTAQGMHLLLQMVDVQLAEDLLHFRIIIPGFVAVHGLHGDLYGFGIVGFGSGFIGHYSLCPRVAAVGEE